MTATIIAALCAAFFAGVAVGVFSFWLASKEHKAPEAYDFGRRDFDTFERERTAAVMPKEDPDKFFNSYKAQRDRDTR